MLSQPMAMPAFYPQMAPPAGTPGMVAAPAFYGSHLATSATGTAQTGTPYTALWPAGQPLVYATGTHPGATFYQPTIYQTALSMCSEAAPASAMTVSAMPIMSATTDATGKPPDGAAAPAMMVSGALPGTIALPGNPSIAQVQGAIASHPMAGQQLLAGQALSLAPEYWAQAAALSQGQVPPGTALVTQNLAAVANAVAAAAGQPSGPVIPGQDVYNTLDERELKRQRRKQSNRESARRSRLRKQAECEDLNKKVEGMAEENLEKRKEVERIKLLCEKFKSDNAALQARLESSNKVMNVSAAPAEAAAA
mmetsp:Transcript_24619/g.68530  ORF Transcript_24619/g.68530 Transcript_24619/m.68530 type:complete len:309 (-) Transcript_24619:184-1110(-)